MNEEKENILVDTLKQMSKIMNLLTERVKNLEEKTENLEKEIDVIKREYKSKVVVKQKDISVDEWSDFIDDVTDREDKKCDNNNSDNDIDESEDYEEIDKIANKNINETKYGKNSKIMEFVINKSDKNKISKEINQEQTQPKESNKSSRELNRVRRNIGSSNIVNVENDEKIDNTKQLKVKKMVETLIKQKNNCDEKINSVENKIIEIEEDDKEETQEQQKEVTKRRRGAKF